MKWKFISEPIFIFIALMVIQYGVLVHGRIIYNTSLTSCVPGAWEQPKCSTLNISLFWILLLLGVSVVRAISLLCMYDSVGWGMRVKSNCITLSKTACSNRNQRQKGQQRTEAIQILPHQNGLHYWFRIERYSQTLMILNHSVWKASCVYNALSFYPF